MKIILFLVLALWLAKAAKDIIFWVYLWQLKEYRLDRMKAHFELKNARRIFFNKTALSKAILLLSSLFLFVEIWRFFFQVTASLFYVLFGIKSLHSAYAQKIKEPVFTKKALCIIAFGLGGMAVVSVILFIKYSYPFFLASILFLDIILPAIIAAIVALFKIPSEIFKKQLFKRAGQKRESLNDLLVIGITGSYGKTSVKEYLAHMLENKLKVLKTEGNNNTEVGVARTIDDKLSENYDVFVAEMGAYKKGEIRKICDIARPQMGILTGINQQHVSLFGSPEEIIKTKYELIESLPRNGLAVFNGENEQTRKLYEKTKMPKRLYSLKKLRTNENDNAVCEKIDFAKKGMRFDMRIGNKGERFETRLLGKHNALNIAGAALVAHALGMTLGEIKKSVKTLAAPPHTLEVKEGIRGSTIIDDTYSANSEGASAALDVLENMPGNKKIIVFYPLIELGKFSQDVHRRLALKINKICDLCILTSPNFQRAIKNNATNTDVMLIQNPDRIVEKLKKILREEDIVLLENRLPEKIAEQLTIKK